LSLEEAKTLIGAIEGEFVSAQAAENVEARRRCSCGKQLAIKDWKLRRIHTTFGRVYLPSPRVMGRRISRSAVRRSRQSVNWTAARQGTPHVLELLQVG
jgi:hypothetical protein